MARSTSKSAAALTLLEKARTESAPDRRSRTAAPSTIPPANGRTQRPTCPAQFAPTGLTQWVKSLQRLQKQADAGELNDCALQMFKASREELDRALLVAQQIARGFRHAPRQAVRIACELPIEVELPRGRVRALTHDVSSSGFSTSLPSALVKGDEVAFTLRLPGRGRTVKGRAQLVMQVKNNKEKRLRSSFAFSAVPDDGIARLQAFVLDRIVRELARD